ncbi:MAG: dTDP-4-dehydrorhamnose reductase [Candidatus Aureabacteria bacterium]|nr:dTDP-4-dehydrorhamnose reductase [Candidatus Auribacterota bacterium]
MATHERILVIGAAGMLGHELMDILSPAWELTGVDIGEVDITDREGTEAYIRELRPHAVVNAAARTDVDGCEGDPDGAFAVNAQGAGYVAAACRAACARMIYLSTDYVFDGRAKKPYREDAATNPQSAYGKSKLAGEQAVRRGLDDYIIVRTSWLFGLHGKNFVDTILRAAARQPVLEVVGDQRGCPTYARDLAKAIGSLLMTDCRGIVNVTNSGVCSWCEYARAILELGGISGVRVNEITSERLSRPAPRPPFSALDGSRYAGLTGAPMRQWREAVGEYMKKGTGYFFTSDKNQKERKNHSLTQMKSTTDA